MELLRLAFGAVLTHRLRSVLSMLGIAIGIASVVLLTSIGEGTRQYILRQFQQFGTNILAVHPGRSETTGLPGVLGGTTQKLTLDDAVALTRVPGVTGMVPLAFGTGRVEAGRRSRSVAIYGVTPEIDDVWSWRLAQGRFWPEGDPRSAPSSAVLGRTLKRELFGEASALGRFIKVGGVRFRVVGMMEPKGRMLGLDLDDSVFVPVSRAMQIFNLSELTEIDLLYRHARLARAVEAEVKAVLTRRHGREDFTIVTQEAMLSVFDNVMNVITLSVGAIGGISLLVGAVGILTMMWIAVGERTQEIGLLRSIGASRRQIQWTFLLEAGLLATLGGISGLTVGLGLCGLLRLAVAGLPITTPIEFVFAALGISLATGLVSGVAPAARAAALDPIEALRAE